MSDVAYERKFREWAHAAGVSWQDLRYPRPEADGETVAYRFTPPRAPRGVVLAVHGAGNDALFAWIGLFKQLLLRGYEVFTFDLDGHGRHSTTHLASGAIDGAIAEAVRRCEAEARDLAVHVVGVSLGGALLLHALPSLPPVVRSATLMVAPLHIRLSRRAIRGEIGVPLLRTLWRERRHYGLTGLIPSFGPFKRGLYPMRLAAEPGPGAFGYVSVLNSLLKELRLPEAARRVRIPVLLVYGERDRLVPPEQGERLARLLGRAELLRLPGETHLTAPLAPAAVAGLLRWLEAGSAAPVQPAGKQEIAGPRMEEQSTDAP